MATIIGDILNNLLVGTFDNDTILGNEGNDLLIGALGNDLLIGGSGADLLLGGEGSDTLKGQKGNDYLNGGDGEDSIYGGSGNDTIFAGKDDDTVIGGSGNDYIVAGSGNDLIRGGKGHDLLLGGDGNDIIFGNLGNDFLNGGNNNDLLKDLSGNNYFYGGSGNDTLISGKGNDYLDGQKDNDSIKGSLGNDTVIGGEGFDTVDYNSFGQGITITPEGVLEKANGDIDTLFQVEKIVGAVGQINSINASSAGDIVSLFADLFWGQFTVNNVPELGSLNFEIVNFVNVIGTSQNDFIVGNAENNVLQGGLGSDFFRGSAGNDTIAGNDLAGVNDDSYDVIDYSGLGTGITLLPTGEVNKGVFGTDQLIRVETITGDAGQKNTLDNSKASGASIFVDLPGQFLRVSINAPNISTAIQRNVINFVDVIGTSQNDFIIGNIENNILQGSLGSDFFRGSAGNDTIAGNDLTGVDDGSYDVVDYSGLGTAITLLPTGEVNKGTLGTDQLIRVETITGEAGQTNILDNSTASGASVNIDLVTETLQINIDTPTFSTVLERNVVNFVDVIGTNRNDRIRGNTQKNIIDGGSGSDTLDGAGGHDTVRGGKGHDLIRGGNGNDRLFGQGGSDRINGGNGNDFLSSGNGNDIAFGSAGNDTIIGGNGNDTVDYSNFGQAVTITPTGIINKADGSTDSLSSIERIIGADNQTNEIDAALVVSGVALDVDLSLEQLTVNNVPVLGSLNFEVENFLNVNGTEERDSIIGDDDINILSGNNGNDTLQGNEGSDTLNGGAGNDTLVGSNPSVINPGSGEFDFLSGGLGEDLFVIGDFIEPYYIGAGFVTITDFNDTEGDLLQAFGSASDYSITPSGSGSEIAFSGDTIAVVSNTTVDFSDFTFV